MMRGPATLFLQSILKNVEKQSPRWALKQLQAHKDGFLNVSQHFGRQLGPVLTQVSAQVLTELARHQKEVENIYKRSKDEEAERYGSESPSTTPADNQADVSNGYSASTVPVSGEPQPQEAPIGVHDTVETTTGPPVQDPESQIPAQPQPSPTSITDPTINTPDTSQPPQSRDMPPYETPRPQFVQSHVPSSRIGRAAGFASLGARLAANAARQALGLSNHSNGDVLSQQLCRMRGAALKLGQMLSIQDESLLPPGLADAMATVRSTAHCMPTVQLVQQLSSQLGDDWRTKFVEFDFHPLAAASIGQVHKATIMKDDEIVPVVVKVQYPGVAKSIVSDLRNVAMLLQFSAPRGLFLDNVLRAAASELQAECDYRLEADFQQRMQECLHNDEYMHGEMKWKIPSTIPELCTEQVLVTEFCHGSTIDKGMSTMNQHERNRLGRAILYLTMHEIFSWRMVQSDPNWGNFLYDVHSRETSLIDFGATREYSKDFVDGHLRMVWSSSNQDREELLDQSHRMKFLTGQENEAMVEAHVESGFTMGEPFRTHDEFDFRGSKITSRMSQHMSVFLQHRLTAPPTEVYTLHRKIAGAYLLCIKLGAKVACRDILQSIVEKHDFTDGRPRPSLYQG